ncbi:hypothetical protein SUGI_0107370 [Cryptomeria japonica]|uniref:uncharacterized protein LOC131060539 n=1 Tax=Cryptomeria japonica TaxID=3369 RepID=UPI002408ECA5|nr:uncharacterized protein LOC131060539 [Cryptomeria japonica]GLJ09363.1 hypothetical protein SUGI_0107370 [Cryptomeria japonica]
MELRSANASATAYRQVAPQIAYGLLPQTKSCNMVNGLHRKSRRVPRLLITAASSGDSRFDSDHSKVDADMIVLRKRIYDLKLQESEDELPAEWMEWERKMYPSYNSMVFYAIAWAQYFLMTARPGVAVGVFVLLSVCVPTSVFFVALNGVKGVGELIAQIQLNL